MTLEYKILWFEDSKDWCESIIYEIQEHIEDELGFSFKEPDYFDKIDNLSSIDFSQYDIILMDLELSGQDGDEIIKRIREKEIYTDIVFYSQKGEKTLRQKVADNQLDGVFCVSRELFLEKVKGVIHTTIRKVQDVNNMRGLVMAEVSELDAIKSSVISEFSRHLTKEEQNIFLKERKQRVVESLEKSIKNIETMDLDSFLDSFVFSTEQKYGAVNNIFKKLNTWKGIDQGKIQRFKEIARTYKEDVINKRNGLAHVREEIEDGCQVLKSNDIVFDNNEFKKIRMDLKKHNSNFENITTYIEEFKSQ